MNIQLDQLSTTALRASRLRTTLAKARPLDFIPARPRSSSEPQLARRKSFLGESGAKPSATELERIMGSNDLVDEFYFERALLAALPVCRIVIRSPGGHVRGHATGFMISPRLLITNAHVFGRADEAAPSLAEFNYRLDVAGNPEPSYRFALRPDKFFFAHPPLDFALVSVEPRSLDGSVPLSAFGYQRLIAESGKVMLKEWMTIIQHPGGAPKQFAIRENQCIEDSDPDVLWYASDTAPGSSGSPVLNDSFQVVALHHSGVARQDARKRYVLKNGTKVKSLADVDDSQADWIANAGIRVSRICATITALAKENDGHLAEFDAARKSGDILSNAYARPPRRAPGELPARPELTATAGATAGATRLTLGSLVLELDAGLLRIVPPPVATPAPSPAPAPAEAADTSGAGAAETLKMPIIETPYTNRKGFDPRFLGPATPLPTVTNPSLIAPMLDGKKIIPYEHFSLVLHRARRMPIYTACNLDGSKAARKPEPDKVYTRAALSGLGEGDVEKWVVDPRVDKKFQIPDKFYTSDDRQKFDKGHICRRDDVCWGDSYAQVRRANGDTYHLTNCSPQRGNFNQSKEGGIWGQLENFIGTQTDTEKLCVFAGPLFSDRDRRFAGTDYLIPSRFWKVICAASGGKLRTYAFILKQDLADVPLEFAVDAVWKARQTSLAILEKEVRLLKFPKRYHAADQK